MAFKANKKFRLIVTLVLVTLITASAGHFISKAKKARPSSAEDRAYTEMYKYKDADGILHYTDTKPKNTEYEVIYMPVSKDKQTIRKTVDGLIGKVLKDKKKKKEQANQTNTPTDNKATDQPNIIKEVKQTLKTVAEQYKDAPEAINEAKKVKQQVEKIYQDREKAMEEMK